ncbi:hypothetical protein WEI85_44305 [Actinomycetes bacterium KLBMP 9797]
MSDQDSLERWYRWLLRAYPRRYRRARATEMLTTLLDGAEPGQRRPHPGDALDLLLGGLRCRFAIPRGPAYLAVAAMVAAFVGLGAAATVGRVTWGTAAPAPDLASARAAAAVAVPLPESGGPGRYDDPLALNYGDDTGPRAMRPGSARAEFSYVAPADRSVSDLVGQARARLVADGWRAEPLERSDHLSGFWASKGERVVLVRGYFGLSNTDSLAVNVHHRAAGWFTPAVGAALGAGSAAGWLLAGWALRRFRRHGARGRLTTVLLGVPSLFTAGMVVLAGAYQALIVGLEGGWAPNDSLFAAAAFAGAGPLAGLATAGLMLAGALVARSPRPGEPYAMPPERAWRYRLWAMTGAHLAFAAAWCAVMGLFLARWLATGDHYGMTHAAHDPKELIPFGVHSMNPFMWLYGLLAILYLFGFMVSPALLAVSVPLLVTARRVTHQAALATPWRALLIAAVTAVALPVLTFTPLGRDAMTWWLD